MLRRVDRVLVRVESLPAAVRYYTQVLGLEIVRQQPNAVTLKLSDDTCELILHDDPDLPQEATYFLVDDVRDLYRRRNELRLTFISPPVQVTRGYRATVKDPFGTVLLLLDRSTDSSATPAAEDARAPGALFPGVEERAAPRPELLIRLYEQIGRTADDLPYTPHFESLYEPYIQGFADPKPDRSEVWRHLLNLRKGGKLPRLGVARSRPPELDDDQRRQLRAMVGSDMGKRDRLPYTKRFDELVDSFNRTMPRPLSPHLVWRAIATLAK
jgi:catechol 2,3-dioxygenase-like lactoylglutathione lyase family enzyme